MRLLGLLSNQRFVTHSKSMILNTKPDPIISKINISSKKISRNKKIKWGYWDCFQIRDL